ncbi:MAG: hypothetical protein HC803_09240 [Saprospiraceae bacterium]|nr:hypothetical protein [Saprospiraceae bacterium]
MQGEFSYGEIDDFHEPFHIQLNGLLAYQFNPYFSSGLGLKSSVNRNGFRLQPYLQARGNYRKESWKKVGLWFLANGIYNEYFDPEFEVATGITVFRPRRSWLFGVGYYALFDNYNYAFSAQFGVQF